MESKDYAWKWVTADECLTRKPSELLYVKFIPSSAATATATVYDGTDSSGTIVVAFRTAQSRQADFTPLKPAYCRGGIFIDSIANVKGIFVQWRVIGD